MKRLKKIVKRVFPVFLSLLIVSGTIFSNLQVAHATGVEQILYYTYYDLIGSIYSSMGYSATYDTDYINTHGVTGKQVWGNFCKWVKNKATLLGLPVKVVNDQLAELVKNATSKGIKMSQDLWDLLRQCLTTESTLSSSTSYDLDIVNELLGVSGYKAASYRVGDVIDALNKPDKNKFNMCYYKGVLFIFPSSAEYHSLYFSKRGLFGLDSSGTYRRIIGTYLYADNNYKQILPGTLDTYGFDSSVQWLVKEGVWITNAPGEITAQVSTGACPKEVPDVSPWIKSPSIPDEWRIVQPGETPEKDPEKDPNVLPFIIPPNIPGKDPDGTEGTETEEKPDKDKDKDKEKKPAYNPIINPITGNVIDPNTGLDIDPNTGKLIDPDTGKLIDPDDAGSGGDGSGTVDKLSKFGDITRLFPFCIPFDIVNLIKGMKAKEAPPIFHFEHYFKSINYTFEVDVDLSDYDKYIRLFRYGMQIFYVLALMFLTIKISKLFI